MALDRDAVNTVTLRLLPPSTALTSATCWLLLHTIPITASLSRTLSRLVSIEETAMAQDPPSAAEPTSSAAPPTVTTSTANTAATRSMRGSATRRVFERSPSSSASSSEAASLDVPCVEPQRGWVELVRVGYIISEIHAYCLLLKCRNPSQAVRMKAALEEGAALGVTAPVEFVSDVQLVTVTRRTFAEPCEGDEMLASGVAETLSSLAGSGTTRDAVPSSFAASPPPQQDRRQEEEQAHEEAKRRNSGATPAAAVGGGEEGQRKGQAPRWCSEVHATTLLDAVVTIYPVRGGGESVEGNSSGYGSDTHYHRSNDRSHAEGRRCGRDAATPSSRHHPSQVRSPLPQMLRRPQSDQALSAPSSPSLQQGRSPMLSPPLSSLSLATTFTGAAAPSTPPAASAAPHARAAVSKGAAPPPPAARHTTAALVSTGPHAHPSLHLSSPCPETCITSSPLRVDGSSPHNRSSHSSKQQQQQQQRGSTQTSTTPAAAAAGSRYHSDEFCAICQVDPLRSGACVTTLCQHSFHLQCYAQLPSGSAECPLCRFSVYELLNDARCEVCGTYEDLWVCLICGHVACGRARRDHQQEHYRSSGHSCSWQSSTNRIWNQRSRMFLHQEVALLLDGAEAEAEGSRSTEREGEESSAGMDRLRNMSWAEPLDEELQEALNESKEEAVACYYSEFLQQLAEEQQCYYEGRLAQQQRRRERQRWRAAMLREQETDTKDDREARKNGGREGSDEREKSALSSSPVYTSVHSIVREERRQRCRVLAEYAPAMVEILQQAQRAYTTVYNTLKSTRDDAQQQVLLRSHYNSGLAAQMEQVRQRTQEAVRKGEKNMLAKSAEEVMLQKKVEDALSSL